MPSVLIRAKLSEGEWRAIRKLALDLDVPVSELVASALQTSPLTAAAFASPATEGGSDNG